MRTLFAFHGLFDGLIDWNGGAVLLGDSTTAYIVRVWIERREVEDAPVEWRGSIEQVAGGGIKYLTDLNEIARFIRPFLEAAGVNFVERAG